MPSTSCEAAATLATASVTGTSAGIAARASLGRDLLVRDHQHTLDALRGVQPNRRAASRSPSACGQTTKPP